MKLPIAAFFIVLLGLSVAAIGAAFHPGIATTVEKSGPLIGIIALIIAAASAVITWYAHETSKLQTRAYVTVTGGGFLVVNLDTGEQGIRARVDFHNSGQTPAYQFSTWVRPPQLLPPDANPFGEPASIEERPNQSVMGPNAFVNIDYVVAIEPDQLAALKAGSIKFFFWGGANYQDIFGTARTFRFRAVSGPPVQSKGQLIFALQPHKLGYEAD